VENAILEGYRRIDELNRIKEALPDFDSVLAISATPTERKSSISLNTEEWNLLSLVDGNRTIEEKSSISLNTEEWNLLSLVDGNRTIEEIVQVAPLSRMDTLRKLAALKLAGLVGQYLGKKRTADRPSAGDGGPGIAIDGRVPGDQIEAERDGRRREDGKKETERKNYSREYQSEYKIPPDRIGSGSQFSRGR